MLLESDSHPQKKWFCLPQWKPFKNEEKCFLFQLKSYFFEKFKFSYWLSWSCEKPLDKKTKFNFKGDDGKGIILVQILRNISKGKDNQEMKLQTFFLLLEKNFIWGKSKWSASSFQYILVVLDLDIQ